MYPTNSAPWRDIELNQYSLAHIMISVRTFLSKYLNGFTLNYFPQNNRKQKLNPKK